MPVARLTEMPAEAVEQWRAARAETGSALPQRDGTDGLEVLELVVDDVAVGGVVLSYAGPRASIRLLETTLPEDATALWRVALDAIERHVAGQGARSVVTAVPAGSVAPFREAGYLAVLTGVGTVLDAQPRLLEDDGRVTVRPMSDAERAVFAAEAGEFLRAGMQRAGVLSGPDAPATEVEHRLARLADDPAPDELLLTALHGDTPIGRFWATLVPHGDRIDLAGNTIDLFPQHRGRGLTRPFMAAVETYAREHGLREVRGRLYGHDARARTTLLGIGLGLDEVHLRKDL